jgi:alpha-L-fucosidase 2
MHTLSVVLLVLFLCCNLVSAQPSTQPVTPPAKVSRDVIYRQVDGIKLRLDAAIPEGEGPFPAVILVHGGGWQAGDKTHFRSLFDPLTRAGFAWFSVDYRLAPKFKFPACLEDVETAVEWVKAHAAEYQIDPNRIALLGESAGGHLVELVATRAEKNAATRPASVVALYAPSDLPALAAANSARGLNILPMLNALFGRTQMDAQAIELLRAASPLTHVKAGLPPFLLLHGTNDVLVPISQSKAFQAACQAVGVPCDLITVKNGPHGMVFWNLIDPSYRERILAFLGQTLKPAPANANSH